MVTSAFGHLLLLVDADASLQARRSHVIGLVVLCETIECVYGRPVKVSFVVSATSYMDIVFRASPSGNDNADLERVCIS